MVWKKRYESHPIFVGIVIFSATVIQMQFSLFSYGASFFNPALGFGLVLGFVFGQRTYPGIIVGAFLGQFFMRFFIYSSLFLSSLFLALFMVMILLAQIELGRKLFKQFQLHRLLNSHSLYSLMIFIVVALFLSLFGAYFKFIIIFLSAQPCTFIDCFLTNLFGDLTGLVVLVPTGIFAYRYDPELILKRKFKHVYKRVLFVLLYIFGVFGLALSFAGLDFLSHAYLLALFFIVIGFLFAYRVIHYFTLIYLLVGRFLYLPQLFDHEQSVALISMVLFTVIMTYLTLMVKRFVDQRLTLTTEIVEKTSMQDALLTDIYNLLHVSENIIEHQDVLKDSKILLDTFKVAHEMFEGIDGAYGYIDVQGTIEIIDTVTYRKDGIPFLYECHQFLDDHKHDFYVMDYVQSLMLEIFGEKYGQLDDMRYPLKSRALIRLMVTPDITFVIGLDRFEHRLPFTKAQKFRIEQFGHLITSLYNRNYYTKHNRSMKEEIVLALVRTLELYDPYTKGHSEDVAFFATKMAEVLKQDALFKTQIYWAGILHDIGKVGIDSKILNKPGKLTNEEYETVKAHAGYGYEIISDSKNLKVISEIVKHHHEWWNGKGYPDNLKEDEIPLGSQIISVADMVSTMATTRPYRIKQKKSVIIKELEAYSETQFSPTVVGAMLSLIHQGLLEERYK